jgi:hypothetical protein
MTVADEVLRELGAHPAGMSDAELAATMRKRHQSINQTCRMLAIQGLIVRESSRNGIVNKISGDTPLQPAHEPRAAVPNTAQEWAWEGHVQSRLATYLAVSGWSILRVADTAQRERGIDIIAERDGQRLLVEVKGWPSTTYARGERAGQPKPTQPTTQAAVWFAEALTTLIRRGAEPESRLAMGLPDMPRYRTLLSDAGWALDRLDITAYLVTADGVVEIWEREN